MRRCVRCQVEWLAKLVATHTRAGNHKLLFPPLANESACSCNDISNNNNKTKKKCKTKYFFVVQQHNKSAGLKVAVSAQAACEQRARLTSTAMQGNSMLLYVRRHLVAAVSVVSAVLCALCGCILAVSCKSSHLSTQMPTIFVYVKRPVALLLLLSSVTQKFDTFSACTCVYKSV